MRFNKKVDRGTRAAEQQVTVHDGAGHKPLACGYVRTVGSGGSTAKQQWFSNRRRLEFSWWRRAPLFHGGDDGRSTGGDARAVALMRRIIGCPGKSWGF